MKVLYVGSSKSALDIEKIKLNEYTTVACNNAWKVFQSRKLDFWIRSGDFPIEDRPKEKKFKEITSTEYEKAIKNLFSEKLNCADANPIYHIGYTIFFQGLYWIMNSLKPKEIHLLGFDHDYNQSKLEIWQKIGMPTPHNRFCEKDKSINLAEWHQSVFGELSDTFYGHGTPDPMRFGKDYIIEKMLIAEEYANNLDISIINLSTANGLNIFRKNATLH